MELSWTVNRERECVLDSEQAEHDWSSSYCCLNVYRVYNMRIVHMPTDCSVLSFIFTSRYYTKTTYRAIVVELTVSFKHWITQHWINIALFLIISSSRAVIESGTKVRYWYKLAPQVPVPIRMVQDQFNTVFNPNSRINFWVCRAYDLPMKSQG